MLKNKGNINKVTWIKGDIKMPKVNGNEEANLQNYVNKRKQRTILQTPIESSFKVPTIASLFQNLNNNILKSNFPQA